MGYGFSTSPSIVTPSADSICRSMADALEDAGLEPKDVSLIMAHATGTRDGDTAEAEAICSVCRESIATASVVSTKAFTGHECWMSGVSQVVYALIQMQGGFIAPHPNLTVTDPAARDINIHTTLVEKVSHKAVLCNAFGFGGTNASLILTPGA